MKQRIQNNGITAMLTALLAAQWFSSTGAGLFPAAGNAAYLSILLAGAGLALLCLALQWCLPHQGLLRICESGSMLRFFPLLAAFALLLPASCALRDAVGMLQLTLLPETPRWYALALMLITVFFMSKGGTAGVFRTIKLLAPVLAAVYALVLVLSGWGQFDLYGLFPLLGTGLSGIGNAVGKALPAGIWLLLLLFAETPAKEARSAACACVWSAVLTAAGFICCAMLQSGAASTDIAFPLHRLSLTGGISFAFERMQAPFVFAWLPVQAAAAALGLAFAAECIQSTFRTDSRLPFLLPLLILSFCLALPDPERCGAWLTTLLQSRTQCILLVPLLLPLIMEKFKEKCRKKEGKEHA